MGQILISPLTDTLLTPQYETKMLHTKTPTVSAGICILLKYSLLMQLP